MKLFIPITKIDLEKREVWGVAAEEAPDKTDEIMDYARSKPHFLAWSAEIEKASGGKSLGNLRAMHQPIAAGKLIHFEPRDEEKRFFVGAKVVDDAEWAKVKEGVYTGFSIGGDYVEKWHDPGNPAMKRYEARPSEISLADNPCMYGAVFEAVKADGVVEMRKFERPGFSKIEEREDVSDSEREAAVEEYGDVKFADPKNKKYPLDTEDHIRSAWTYIHQEKNRAMYDADEVNLVESRIVAAWKEKIDEDGPPSAEKIDLTSPPSPLLRGEGGAVEKVGRMLNSVNADSLRTMLAMLADMLAAAGDDLGGKVKLLLDDSGDEPGEEAAKSADGRGDAVPKLRKVEEVNKAMPKSFLELVGERQLRDVFWGMFWALDDCVYSILCDPEVALDQKKAMLAQAASDFAGKVQEAAGAMTPEAMEMAAKAHDLGKLEAIKGEAKTEAEVEIAKIAGQIGEIEKAFAKVAEIEKLAGKIGEMEKLAETVVALDARLAKVETQPVGEPPVLRQVATPNGASGITGELAVLDGMIEQETNPLVKEALGKRRALLMLKAKS